MTRRDRKFGAKSTTEDVLEGVDLTGKRVLITGGSSGLGVESARALAAHGASVTVTARDVAKAELAVRIEELKARRNAVVLAHNYMEPALFHSVADYTGDSLELCRRAATAECDVIVFCGVRFMAETAKVLNPGKTVLLPDPDAGCSLAESITAADVRNLRARFPGVPVVAYVNTGADVKSAAEVGRLIAERALAAGVKDVVFDRGGYKYHGRVKALAAAAREGGLSF